jgi:aminopeptidase N
MARRNIWLLLVVSATILSSVLSFAQVRQADDERKLHEAEGRRALALVKAIGELSEGSRSYDVTYYKLDVRITTEPTSISGAVSVRAFSRADSLKEITLDLVNSLTVDSVIVDGLARSFVQSSQSFDIDLGQARPSGAAFTAIVYYRGIPTNSGFGSFASTTTPGGYPWIWTLSEPYGARGWWPCNDHPSDKADSLDVWITVPGALKAGSQGILESVLTNPDGTKTYRWKHRYPIATYLVSLAITNYDVVSYWFKYSPTDSMEVLNYILPGTGVGSLPETVVMLGIYTQLFGPYPFLTEKYGHAEFGWGGAMEHQTMTSTGSTSEGIIAHELAHQWFGDMITLETWPHIWLNEGFATYGEVLYEEQRYGTSTYQAAMYGKMLSAMTATTTLYVTDTTNLGILFSNALVYDKGASVLHMLRHVVGDSLFFCGLKAYAGDPRFVYGTATTEDFRGVFETVSGMDLKYFFDEWVYGELYPQYSYQWGTAPEGDRHRVLVEISQTTGTANPAVFTMPIDLRIVGLETDTTVVVFNTQSPQTFAVTVPFEPTNVVLDPDSWILKTSGGVQVGLKDGRIEPVSFELEQNFPNPFNASTTFRFSIGEPSRVLLEVFDILGRRVDTAVDEIRGAGFYSVRWSAEVPTGTYVVRLQAVPTDGAPDIFAQSRAIMVLR